LIHFYKRSIKYEKMNIFGLKLFLVQVPKQFRWKLSSYENQRILLLRCSLNSRFCSTTSNSRFDASKAFSYYEILGVPRTAKQSDIKHAYFRLAKIYHPDVNREEGAREDFDKITEAYTTLIDLTQRYFYDRHGHTSEELKKKGTPSIFEWTPKYGIYQAAEDDSAAVEDWFKAQGHRRVENERLSVRQWLKNAYVELRFGLNYYNFPWEIKSLLLSLILWALFLLGLYEAMRYAFYNAPGRKPIQTNFKWENDEVYDILWYSGARKSKPSSQSKGGMYHMPKAVNPKKSEYSHTIYSNTRSRTKSKNMVKHRRLVKELNSSRLKAWKLDQNIKEENRKKRKKKKNDGFNVV